MRVMQSFGCLGLALMFFFLCLMPIFFVDMLNTAMLRLHLSPAIGTLAVLGILLGSMFNVPLYRISRAGEQVVAPHRVFNYWGPIPHQQIVQQGTVIAINIGGGVIPVMLAAWEAMHVLDAGSPARAMLLATAVNVVVCYMIARPVRGIGIMMPGLTSPLVAVMMTWLLLGGSEFEPYRASVAFVAGVSGPLIGADLLHLKDITRVSVGMLSIGGAGTFDGIVLSGILAALLA